MKNLIFLIGLLLLSSCKKEDFDANVAAYFEKANKYTVLSSSSLQFEAEIVFTTEGTFKSHGHVWSETNMTPTLDDQFTDLGELKASGKFNSKVEGLEYGKLYYYRSYVHAGKDRIFYGITYTASTAWQPREGPANITGLRDGVSFVIGNKAYMGLGSDNYYPGGGHTPGPGNISAMWQFDGSTNQWREIKAFPGGSREESFSFVINGKAYVGGGGSGQYLPPNGFDYSLFYSDFWKYDPATDIWTLVGDLPASLHRIGFEINGYGFSFDRSNFYRYSPTDENGWTAFPTAFGSRVYTTSFVVNRKAYLIGGYQIGSTITLSDDVLEYNPVNQSWTKKSNFPGGPLKEAVSFVIDNQAYVGTGARDDNSSSLGGWTPTSFWRYNAGSDTWQQAESIPVARQGGMAFTIGNRAFVGFGGDGTEVRKDFWEYMPKK